MPRLTIVADKIDGYGYVLTPDHSPIDDVCQSIIKAPPFNARFGADFPGIPCKAWRYRAAVHPHLARALSGAGFAIDVRDVSEFAPKGALSKAECPDCTTPRQLGTTGCACGSTAAAVPSPPPPRPGPPAPAPPGWRAALTDIRTVDHA